MLSDLPLHLQVACRTRYYGIGVNTHDIRYFDQNDM